MEAPPGTRAEILLDVVPDDIPVRSAQSDLSVAGPLAFLTTNEGSPDCTVLSERPVAVSFEATGCDHHRCSGVRTTIVTETPFDEPLLCVCSVAVPADAMPALYPLSISSATAADANNIPLEATTRDDVISVPQLPKSGALVVGTVVGLPGQEVSFDVSVDATVGAQVIGVVADIRFDPLTPVLQDDVGQPRCAVRGTPVDDSTAFFFLPRACVERGTCDYVSADFRVTDDPDRAFPSGSVMFSCRVAIAASAVPGVYPFFCQSADLRTYDTGFISTDCRDGAVRVLAPDTPMATPTATPPPPTVTRPATSTATASGTPTAAAIRTMPGAGSGGCATAAPTAAQAWCLLLPLAGLRARRRLRRPPSELSSKAQ